MSMWKEAWGVGGEEGEESGEEEMNSRDEYLKEEGSPFLAEH